MRLGAPCPSRARHFPERPNGFVRVRPKASPTPRFKEPALAKQRIRLCGHFGSIEFELLQILQGRRRDKWTRFPAFGPGGAQRFALVHNFQTAQRNERLPGRDAQSGTALSWPNYYCTIS